MSNLNQKIHKQLNNLTGGFWFLHIVIRRLWFGKKIPRGDGTFLAVPDGGFKARNVLLPIPEQEIKVNPLVTQIRGIKIISLIKCKKSWGYLNLVRVF